MLTAVNKMKDFIIIPTYNERGNISRLIPRIFQLYPDINVIVVDDSSPDGIAEEVKKLMQKYPNLELNSRPRKLGLGTAYIQTFQKLLNEHGDIRSITEMDADFSHAPETIKTFLKEIDNFDLVIGSRYMPGGSVKNWSIFRKVLSRGGNIYAKMVTGIPINDLTAGFKCYRAGLLRKYDFNFIHSNGYAYQIEMKNIAWRLGAGIKEIPITFTERIEGVSKISGNIIYEGIIAPWRIRFSTSPGRTNHI